MKEHVESLVFCIIALLHQSAIGHLKQLLGCE